MMHQSAGGTYEERVTRESEERIKSEALVYMITHWLLYALGQA